MLKLKKFTKVFIPILIESLGFIDVAFPVFFRNLQIKGFKSQMCFFGALVFRN